MAVGKVHVELDEDLVRRLRTRSAASGASDSEVVSQALVVALGLHAMRESQERSGLEQDEADAIAVAEVRAARGSGA